MVAAHGAGGQFFGELSGERRGQRAVVQARMTGKISQGNRNKANTNVMLALSGSDSFAGIARDDHATLRNKTEFEPNKVQKQRGRICALRSPVQTVSSSARCARVRWAQRRNGRLRLWVCGQKRTLKARPASDQGGPLAAVPKGSQLPKGAELISGAPQVAHAPVWAAGVCKRMLFTAVESPRFPQSACVVSVARLTTTLSQPGCAVGWTKLGGASLYSVPSSSSGSGTGAPPAKARRCTQGR